MSESDYIPYEALVRFGPARALVLAPHPDDEVLGCGGALIQHVLDGDPVQVVVLTDGALGGHPVGEGLAARRRDESIAASKLIGYPEPCFIGLPDRGLEAVTELPEILAGLIERFQADLVYVPSLWEIHPDHQALSRAAVVAMRGLGRSIGGLFYEVGYPLRPNRLLDITPHRALKARAIGCFKSQLEVQDYRRHIEGLNAFRTYTLSSDCLAAEAYRRFDSRAMGFQSLEGAEC